MLDKHTIQNQLTEAAKRLKDVNRAAQAAKVSGLPEPSEPARAPLSGSGVPPLSRGQGQGRNAP